MDNKEPQVTITEEIPAWRLQLAYFYTEHKTFLKKGAYFFLFFIDLIILFTLGTLWVNYKTGLIKDQRNLKKLPVNLVDSQALKNNRPQTLSVGQTYSLATGAQNYNLLAKITNNNREWAIPKITYTFIVNQKQLSPRTSFILPYSEKYLMYFNVPQADNAQLKILNISWQRVKDYSLLSYKDQIKTIQADFKPSSNKEFTGTSSIEIYNDSPYDYWEVGLPIILYNRQLRPLAIDYIVINKFKSQEKRHLEINWTDEIKDRVYQTGIYPEVNLLNKGVIMKITAPPGSPPGYE